MKFSYLFLIITATVVGGCAGENAEKGNQNPLPVQTEEEAQKVDALYKGAKTIFYSMPSPLELTTLIKAAGGEFHPSLLLNPNQANQYQGNLKKSLVLGIYAADLSYSTVYEQQNDAIKYLAACKRIGESIGIHEAFTADIIERANANIANRDSMLSIMTEMYWNTNSQLREENREQIALLIMSAAWVEGLYLGSSLLNPENPDPEIAMRMAEQKFASAQLKGLFEAYSDDPLVAEATPMFEPVFNLFTSLSMTEDEAVSAQSNQTGTTTISGKKSIFFSPKHIANLKTLSSELRTQIVEQ